MQKSNSKTPLRTGGRSESFSAYTTNSHSTPTTPANSVYSYQWTIVSPAMSSYDSSHGNYNVFNVPHVATIIAF